MKVNEIMSRRVVKVTSVTMLPDVARMMSAENIGVIPIEEEGKLIGVVTDRDIAVRAVAKRSIDRPVKEIMTAKPVTIDPGASIDDAIRLMLQKKVRRLLVAENGKLLGIVSLEDLLEGGKPAELLDALKEFHQQTRHE